jgi:hypothetical protein
MFRPVSTIIRRRPTLRRKHFASMTCICCLCLWHVKSRVVGRLQRHTKVIGVLVTEQQDLKLIQTDVVCFLT